MVNCFFLWWLSFNALDLCDHVALFKITSREYGELVCSSITLNPWTPCTLWFHLKHLVKLLLLKCFSIYLMTTMTTFLCHWTLNISFNSISFFYTIFIFYQMYQCLFFVYTVGSKLYIDIKKVFCESVCGVNRENNLTLYITLLLHKV